MSNLFSQSQELRNQVPELISRQSADDIEFYIIQREEMRQELTKEMDKLSDSIREKKDAIRALQSQIDVLMQDKRVLQSLKGDHAVDVSKLTARKWDLLREARAYNLPK
jgi:SMC interacting uncharacterized protein involved in chromosome segregation